MSRSTLLRQRLATLWFVAVLLLFSPLALRFESFGSWRAIPTLFIYLYGVWALIIALSAWIASTGRD